MSQVVLVDDGAPRAVILLGKDPHVRERQAAEEIVTYVEKISGMKPATLVVGSASDQVDAKVRILVGSIALAGSGGPISVEDIDQAKGDRFNTCYEPDGFVLSVQPDIIALAGVRPEGTVYAAVELLEWLGCRWFFPDLIQNSKRKNR